MVVSVALFLSMLAVACSGGGSGADSSASAAPAEPRTPDTCGEYRNLTAEQIAEVFSEKRQVTIYDDTGVRQGSETELYDYYCALPTSDDNHSLFNGEIGGLGAAECGRYLPLDPTAKQSWVTEVRKDENYPESQQSMAVDDFDRACFGLGGADDLFVARVDHVELRATGGAGQFPVDEHPRVARENPGVTGGLGHRRSASGRGQLGRARRVGVGVGDR